MRLDRPRARTQRPRLALWLALCRGPASVSGLAAALVATACATARPPALATLRLRCNVAEATLWIDDTLVGRASEWAKGRAMPAGFRRVEVRAPGYFTFYAEVSPKTGEAVALDAELQAELD